MNDLIQLTLTDAKAVLAALPAGEGEDLRRLVDLAGMSWMSDAVFLEVEQGEELAGLISDERLIALLRGQE